MRARLRFKLFPAPTHRNKQVLSDFIEPLPPAFPGEEAQAKVYSSHRTLNYLALIIRFFGFA